MRAREAGRDPQCYLEAATYLAEQKGRAGVEDHLIENTHRPAGEVAAEALRLARWVGGVPAYVWPTDAREPWLDGGKRVVPRLLARATGAQWAFNEQQL